MESIRSGRFVFDRGSDENDLTRRLVRSSPTKGKGSVFFVKSRKSKLRVVYLGWMHVDQNCPRYCFWNLKKIQLHPGKLTFWTQKWRFGRSCSFSNGWFSGSMFVFLGSIPQKKLKESWHHHYGQSSWQNVDKLSLIWILKTYPPESNIFAPENRPGPKKRFHFPTIHFQVRTVSYREGKPKKSNWLHNPHLKLQGFSTNKCIRYSMLGILCSLKRLNPNVYLNKLNQQNVYVSYMTSILWISRRGYIPDIFTYGSALAASRVGGWQRPFESRLQVLGGSFQGFSVGPLSLFFVGGGSLDMDPEKNLIAMIFVWIHPLFKDCFSFLFRG